MNSIFSNYLAPLGSDYCNESKPSKVYDQLRIAYNQGAKGILDNTRMVTFSDDDDEIIYEIWRNSRLHYIITWINKKITLALGQESYQTIDVRIRIAISMLNKIIEEGCISKKIGDLIYNRLVTNVRREMSAINTEDLPF